jgi:hypothetical protein
MKKTFYLLSICILTVANAWGQQDKKVNFGIRQGIHMSDVFHSTNDAKLRKTGLQTSFFVDIPVEDVYAISTGLSYMQSGENVSFEVDRSIPTFVAIPDKNLKRFNYLQIPVHFSLRENGFRFDVGFYGGYFLGGNSKWHINGKTMSDTPLTGDGYSLLRRTDGGISLQGGLATKSGLEIMVYSQVGLLKVEESVFAIDLINRPTTPSFEGRNISAGLSVGYRF